METYDIAIRRGLNKTIQAWFTEQCKNPFERYYLFYEKNNPAMQIAQEKPDSQWKLASPLAIRTDHTVDQVFRFCWGVMGRLPILPLD